MGMEMGISSLFMLELQRKFDNLDGLTSPVS
jgi:hypothetical protein